MAGVARQKTPLEKAGAAAREALTKAKDANEKTPNAATKKTVEDATLKAKEATKAENIERFHTIGAGRVANVVVKLNALAKCANKRSYDFTEKNIDEIEAVLTKELASVIETFRNNLKSAPKAGPVKSTFKFS